MIDLKCPQCGKELHIDEKYAGKSGRCRHCQQEVTVPGGTEGWEETPDFARRAFAGLLGAAVAVASARLAIWDGLPMWTVYTSGGLAAFCILGSAVCYVMAALPWLTEHWSSVSWFLVIAIAALGLTFILFLDWSFVAPFPYPA